MDDLSAELMAMEDEERANAEAEALAAKVDAFGASLAKKREDAINGRKNSGIEEEWIAAEEAYQGIDDANRGQQTQGKPSGPNGGYINGPAPTKTTRSTVFVNITRPYTDAAAAKVGDMLLPSDDSPWGLRPTPKPSTMDTVGKSFPGVVPMLEQATPGAPYQPADPAQQPQPPQANPIQQAIDELHASAKASAEGAQKQIEDWLIECQWHSEVRKMIEDCARLGTGVLKGPYPVRRSATRTAKAEDGSTSLVKEVRIAPASRCISPWRLYPDPACGDSIHNGSYCWEQDDITARSLRELKDVPGYIASQIDKVLEEGPSNDHSTQTDQPNNVKAKDSDQYKIWYFYGFAEREDLVAAGVDLPEGTDITVPAIVTMVNHTVIKAALSPLGEGEFPYDLMVWQRRPDVPWGIGVATQISTPQRMLNASTRNMMDNAGLSAGPQIVIRRDAVSPADGVWQMTPRKFWFVKEGADVNAVNQAFLAVNIPTMQDQLMNIIQFALKMAEDVTGLPMLMQGQQGAAPDTVGGMQMMLNNASVVLRRIARLFDDRVTEPHIRRYYNWLMEYGEDDSIKGDFQIDARGSTALVERDIQNQAIVQMGNLVSNPSFGIDPEKWFAEMCKSQRIDPKRLQMDEEKKAALANQPPPLAPQVEAAKIRAEADLQKAQLQSQLEQALAQMKAQSDLQIAQMREQLGLQKIQVDTDRDRVYVEAQIARDQTTAQAKFSELELKRELAMLDYANRQQMTLEQVKAKLAETVMKLNTTKELAGLKASADKMPTPPVEPPGRAPAGESFQK